MDGALKSPGKRDSGFDDWHGSTAILKALQAGLITEGAALDRMNLSHYRFAAEILPAGQVDAIAERIEAALAKALSYEGDVEHQYRDGNAENFRPNTAFDLSLTERIPSESDVTSDESTFGNR